MDQETIDTSKESIAKILRKMETADIEFCNEIRAQGLNFFVEFTREYFGEYMKPVHMSGTDEYMLTPTPQTENTDLIGLPRKPIPDNVTILGVDFTKTEVETCIRLSNVHLE